MKKPINIVLNPQPSSVFKRGGVAFAKMLGDLADKNGPIDPRKVERYPAWVGKKLYRKMSLMCVEKGTPTITLRCKTPTAQERELQRRYDRLRTRGYLGPVVILYPDGRMCGRLLCSRARRNMYLVNEV